MSSFIAAKQKAQAYKDAFGGSAANSRSSSSTAQYLDNGRGSIDNMVGSNFRMPAADQSADQIQSRTSGQLGSLMNTGLQSATQQFGTLSQLNNQAVDTAIGHHNQGQINAEQLKRSKLGQPSSLGTALGYASQGLSFAGSLGSFGSPATPGGAAPGGAGYSSPFFSQSNPLAYSSGFSL